MAQSGGCPQEFGAQRRQTWPSPVGAHRNLTLRDARHGSVRWVPTGISGNQWRHNFTLHIGTDNPAWPAGTTLPYTSRLTIQHGRAGTALPYTSGLTIQHGRAGAALPYASGLTIQHGWAGRGQRRPLRPFSGWRHTVALNPPPQGEDGPTLRDTRCSGNQAGHRSGHGYIRGTGERGGGGLCSVVAYRPSNRLVYLRDGSA